MRPTRRPSAEIIRPAAFKNDPYVDRAELLAMAASIGVAFSALHQLSDKLEAVLARCLPR